MKEKINFFGTPITVGIVGHVPLEQLHLLQEAIESVPDFDMVFFKTSAEKLWIKEGVENDY
jgi:hypothetical protein